MEMKVGECMYTL